MVVVGGGEMPEGVDNASDGDDGRDPRPDDDPHRALDVDLDGPLDAHEVRGEGGLNRLRGFREI